MKYIFFGTPDFSARCLTILLDHGIVPITVVCNPDRPVGRKKIITPPPVKTAAQAWMATTGKTIEILQPEKIDAEFRDHLRVLNSDFFVVYAYNKIFRKETLDVPLLGTIGIHPSLLPKYRGPSPFQTAILDGETQTGVTLYFLDEGIDSGPILAKSDPVPITDEDTFHSVAMKLAEVGANLFIKNISDIASKKITPQPQDESQATFTKKFKTEDGFVAPEDLAAAIQGDAEKAHSILRKINALNPEPGAWTTTTDGKRMKLLKAKIEGEHLALVETQEEGQKTKRLLPHTS
jgi:methionyl-tRNA formyltransferase